MSENSQDLFLHEAFASKTDLPADEFTSSVMTRISKRRRRRILLRFLPGLLLAPIAPPVQDLALALTELLMVSLVNIDQGLIADILAPVNTVAALLSAILLLLRVSYLKLFR